MFAGCNCDVLLRSSDRYNQRSGFRDTDMTIYASGELVVARFSLDSRWYRARVINTDPDVSLVKVSGVKVVGADLGVNLVEVNISV